jgi:uncharacterized protein (DUF433 family)
MAVQTEYKYLEPRPGSNYRQLFVKGRKIRAEILYRLTVNSEPQTPEQVAEDYGLPVEAVREAIDYSLHNEELLRKEREQELEYIRTHGLDRPPFAPPDYNPEA